MTEHAPSGHAAAVKDHWWWRPGMRPGRRVYAWHITFQTGSPLHDHAADYQQALAAVENLDLIPQEWLHLTIQGIGFTDEMGENEIADVIDRTRQRFADWEPFDLEFGKPIIRPEAVAIHPTPGETVVELRHLLREAIANVRGESRVEGSADGFQPHVSVAYVNADGPSAPIARAIDQADTAPVACTVDHISLIRLHRDNKMYEWETVESVDLRSGA